LNVNISYTLSFKTLHPFYSSILLIIISSNSVSASSS